MIGDPLMSEGRILEGWKAIADYLEHTENTCRKWEREFGLPVHRLDDSPKAHVFAYSDELERWKQKKVLPERGRLARWLLGPRRRAGFWLVLGSGVAVLVIVELLVGPARFTKSTAGPQTVKSIAVLPFVDLSPGKDQEHLGDGIADILINALNAIEGLRTPARTSAFYFKGKDATPEEIGEKLKVEWILEGSVQVHENRLRVVATLVSADDGFELWTEKYDRNLADIFAIEDEIARRVVDNLKIRIAGERGTLLVKPGTVNIEAYNLYLNGQFHLKRGRFSLKKAIGFFESALEKDPNYAEAYAAIAVAFEGLGLVGLLRPSEAFPKARAAASRALEIDSRNAFALGVLSSVKAAYDWDFRGAENDIRKAIRDDPGNPYLHAYYGKLLISLARYDEALEEIELLLRQDQFSLDFIGCSAEAIYYFSRRYDLALEGYKKRLELDPQNGGMYINLVLLYLAMGRYEDARAANQRRREVLGTCSEPDDLEPWNAMVYAHTGNPARAREILAHLKAKYKDGYYPYHLYAWIHAALGEKDEAFFWLERAYRERDGQLFRLKIYPPSDPLRDDPRFKDLLRRIGLER